jgi:enoyl-CoA hydratase/carnithine racemase
MSELVLTQQRDEIFEIIFNRPEKRNAINRDLYLQFDEAITKASRASGVRAVIIRGEGAVFSAGIDVTSFMGMADVYGPD